MLPCAGSNPVGFAYSFEAAERRANRGRQEWGRGRKRRREREKKEKHTGVAIF
jgi:hypothetical protein